MKTEKIHICLVSAQILANIIPILMDKPSAVILISTKTMQQNGTVQRFEKILDDHDIKHELYTDMPSTNMSKIYDYAQETSIKIQDQYPNHKLILNTTCGTKLMSQGFIEVMEEDATLIYTDTQHNRLEYLGKNKSKKATNLQGVLDIKTYLKAYGANFKQAFSDPEIFDIKVNDRKKVTKYLGQNAHILQSLIRDLNGLVHGNKKTSGAIKKVGNTNYKLDRPTQYLSRQPQGERQKLLSMLNDASILKWKNGKNNKEVTFIDVEKSLFIAGGWLEEYVYHIAKDTKDKTNKAAIEVKSGVKISWDSSQKTHNELDVVIVHNNRLLIIECKTSTFGGQFKEKDANILYKIDSLGDDLKGLFGSVWLVSAQNTKNTMRDRAKDRKISIIETEDLKNLRNNIRDWMSN